MAIKALTFDAYGTLLRSDLRRIPERIVTDHRLVASADEVLRAWIALYHEATQATPFRTLRKIQDDILARVLRAFELETDHAPYVDMFFELTTTAVKLYPEVLPVLSALEAFPSIVLSNADEEHVAAWSFTLPVRFVLISETVQAYKPDRRMFEAAVQRLGLSPDEVLHVGDSDVDDIQGAKAAGLSVAWVNRDGRTRRADVPEPDFEMADLTGLLKIL